jgi:hypothetical protein
MLKTALTAIALVISISVTTAKAESDLSRQNAAVEKMQACADRDKHLHQHAECGQRVIAQVPAADRNELFKEWVKLLPELDRRENDPAEEAKMQAYLASPAGRQESALKKIQVCHDEKHQHRHMECGRQVMAQVPAEDRNDLFEQWVDILAKDDQSDRVEAAITASSDRRSRSEEFLRDLKTARSPVEMQAIIARYCTGHGELRLGMTMLEVEQDTSWCVPYSINETITASGKRVQFAYYADKWGSGGNAGFLYFEGGRLVAIQRHS